MMKVSWSPMEAYLASLQLRNCGSHDSCHNSAFNKTSGRVFMSGQNIFYYWQYGERFPTSTYIEIACSMWFEEYLDTPMDAIDKLYLPAGVVIGHFTQMMFDKNDAIGCAMTVWTEDNGLRSHTQLTCNHFRSHQGNKPVYEKGPHCSRCVTCDEDYQSLCS